MISVGSIDEDLARSEFSDYNDQLNLCAPGNEILSLSTQPSVTLYDHEGKSSYALLMLESVYPQDVLLATPQFCGLGVRPCTSAYGKICVFARGSITFADKARNCEKSGGVAGT